MFRTSQFIFQQRLLIIELLYNEKRYIKKIIVVKLLNLLIWLQCSTILIFNLYILKVNAYMTQICLSIIQLLDEYDNSTIWFKNALKINQQHVPSLFGIAYCLS